MPIISAKAARLAQAFCLSYTEARRDPRRVSLLKVPPQVSVDIERQVRNVDWNDLGHVIYSMVIQPEHNVNNGHTRRTVSRAFRTTCV